jgi:hypothetical protein
VLALVDGRVAAWSRTTDTIRVPAGDGGVGFFVKRYFYPRWWNRVRGALRGTLLGRHRAAAEARLLNQMRTLGIAAARPVAWGCRRTGGFVSACFLITEEVPRARNLTAFAADVAEGRIRLDHRTRRLMIDRLARRVAEMHEANFSHGQLFWRNILLRFGPGGEPEFFFLDARPRPHRRRFGRGQRWQLEEIAQLLVSAAAFTTRSERLLFLMRYFDAERFTPQIRVLAGEIEQLSQRWRPHEQQRIRMNRRFEAWSRELSRETAGEPREQDAFR